MKIPQDVKKLGRRFECHPPKDKQSGKGKQSGGFFGRTNTNEQGKNCPAYGRKCMKCEKFIHFSSVWKSKGPHNSKKGNDQKRVHKPPENSRHKRRVKRTAKEGDADHSTSSDKRP